MELTGEHAEIRRILRLRSPLPNHRRMTVHEGVVEIDADDVYLWIEQRASICLKASHKGDPAELTSGQARKLAAVLVDLANQIDQEEAGGS